MEICRLKVNEKENASRRRGARFQGRHWLGHDDYWLPYRYEVIYLEVLSVEGQTSGDERVENDSERPDVDFGPVVLLPLEQLGRRVRRTAAKRVQLVPCNENCQPAMTTAATNKN